jgi:hypothetical protein
MRSMADMVLVAAVIAYGIPMLCHEALVSVDNRLHPYVPSEARPLLINNLQAMRLVPSRFESSSQ